MAPTETSNSDKLFEQIDEERMRSLEQKVKYIKYIERAESKGKILTEEERDLLRQKPALCTLLNDLPHLFGLPRSRLLLNSTTNNTTTTNLDNHDHCLGSSQVGHLEKSRYLLISYGFMICCLDLKMNQDESKGPCSLVQPLPDISVLELLKEGLPISMGLFKVHSDTYMVGGQEFPRLNNPTYIWDTNPFSFLYARFGVKGSSRDTYHLSLADRDLSLNECDVIGPLNKPKVWPIVEKFGDKIHVIESLPDTFRIFTPERIPTHEVLDLKHLDHGWMELPPVCAPDSEEMGLYIANYIVVGERLYATSCGYMGFVVFDTEASKWEWHPVIHHHACDSLLSIKHVTQIFEYGFGSCTVQIRHGEKRYPLYVIVALGEHDNEVNMIAVAYLVSSRGQILCFQCLPHFFDRFKQPFEGNKQGTVIKIDEGGETMCAIFEGITTDTWDEFICITKFTVKVYDGAWELARNLMSKAQYADDFSKLPPPMEKNFVSVVVKDLYVYQRQADPKKFDDVNWQPSYKACFL